MKKFIVKNLYYLLPLLILHLIVYVFYPNDVGPYNDKDLLRVSYSADYYPNYRNIFDSEYSQDLCFNQLTDDTISNSHKVFTIGDSFSKQIQMGYQNYLAKNHSLSILHYGENISSGNPLQNLYELANGDFFNKNKVEYVVLESVERFFVHRGLVLDTLKTKKQERLKKDISLANAYNKKHSLASIKKDTLYFPSEKIIRFPVGILTNFLFDDRSTNQSVYKVKTTKRLFSINQDELLFYHEDIRFLSLNNKKENVEHLNKMLNQLANKLKQKNIKLIVFIALDKYNLYYDHILDNSNKNKYPRPLFSDLLKYMNKDYIYIDTKEVLNKYIEREKDLYYYANSHWSPWAAKIIAKEIDSIIRLNDKNRFLDI